jgi:apolipoprotein N-acyltransferase
VRIAIDRRFVLAALLAAVIGFAISLWPLMFIASICVPAWALRQHKRAHAITVAFAYYAGATGVVISGAKTFFGAGAGLLDGITLWLIGAALLCVPYALIWSESPRLIWLRAPAAVLMSVPPPLGILGVASPLTAAGLLFPGTGWLGLAATLMSIAALCVRPAFTAWAIAAIAFSCNLAYPGNPRPPSDWQAVSTHFGGLGLNGVSAEDEFQAAEFIQQAALHSNARVIVFPETAVPRWTEATDLFWQPTLEAVASSGKTMLIGTTFDIPGQPGYENGIVIRGAQAGVFLQHIPVPVGMWNPMRSSSVPFHILNPSVVTVGNHRTAIIICYEQFLTWPILKAFLDHPDVFVSVANDYWARDTRIPALQSQILKFWARLFRSSKISATND